MKEIQWEKISKELREWYLTIKRSFFKGPLLIIATGISCLGQEKSIFMILLEFILKYFFEYTIPVDNKGDIDWMLRNLLGVLLVLFGCYLIKSKVLPSQKKKKATLVIHEILRTFDTEELKNVLNDYQLKVCRLDFTNYFKGGQLTHLQKVLEKHKKLIHKIVNGSCIYYGQAHIPFIVFSSFLMGKRTLNALERDHKTGTYSYSWLDEDNALEPVIVNIPDVNLSNEEEIALKVSFSVEVLDQHITDKLKNINIASISLEKITLRSIKGKKDLDNFISEYRNLVESIKNKAPRLKVIHLFIAAPPSIPLRIGAMLSQTHDPELRVYNWTNETGYSWGISIQKGKIVHL